MQFFLLSLPGRDLTLNKEGGTWLGMTKFGQVGMLTNYRSRKDFSSSLNESNNVKSRGNIVLNYLSSQIDPNDYINGLIHGNDSYSPFNVLLGEFQNDSGFKFFYGNNVRSEVKELDDGMKHVDCFLL